MVRPRSTPSYRIDPFDLRLFAAVVEEGTITAGARQIHLSLAAASARLQRLEHEVGARLLHRSKSGVTPTDAGQTLLRHAGNLQREIDTLHAEMAAHARGVRSTIRVLCNTAAMTEYLPPLLGRFLVEHPDVDIDLRELGSQDVLQAMHQERADIGIVGDYVGLAGLETHPFREDQLVCLAPKSGPKFGKRCVNFLDLLDHPFVGLPGDSGLSRFLQSQALHFGRTLHHRVRVRSLDAVVRLVADGVGIAVVPERAAQRLATDQMVSRRLADQWARRQLFLCTTGNAPLSVSASALLGFLAPADHSAGS
ncbi:MAG: LysR family transcriptional regulator [Rhodocyclaceae bacterium]